MARYVCVATVGGAQSYILYGVGLTIAKRHGTDNACVSRHLLTLFVYLHSFR